MSVWYVVLGQDAADSCFQIQLQRNAACQELYKKILKLSLLKRGGGLGTNHLMVLLAKTLRAVHS